MNKAKFFKPNVKSKLNLGSGSNHIKGYYSIDAEKSCKPDLVLDFTKERLPFPDSSVDEIIFFHCIEHIQKSRHPFILSEVQRVLKPKTGFVLISYPEFRRVATNWLTNHQGKKEFWEHTIYGLQRYPSDFHVSLMDTVELSNRMRELGFKDIKAGPEDLEPFNTLLCAKKGRPLKSYEQLIADDMNSLVIKNGYNKS